MFSSSTNDRLIAKTTAIVYTVKTIITSFRSKKISFITGIELIFQAHMNIESSLYLYPNFSTVLCKIVTVLDSSFIEFCGD